MAAVQYGQLNSIAMVGFHSSVQFWGTEIRDERMFSSRLGAPVACQTSILADFARIPRLHNLPEEIGSENKKPARNMTGRLYRSVTNITPEQAGRFTMRRQRHSHVIR